MNRRILRSLLCTLALLLSWAGQIQALGVSETFTAAPPVPSPSPSPAPSSGIHSPDSAVYAFFDQLQAQHQEKVWLHLDKPYYGVGDTLWLRGYLVEALTHAPDTLSNFLYVNLYNRQGECVIARKVKRDSLGFAHGIPLPRSLAAGEYTLQAYTGWMLNFSSELFYQQTITLGNSQVDPVRSQVSYTADQAIVRFSDESDFPLYEAKASYELFDKTGKRISGARQTTSSTGALFVELPADSIRTGGYLVTQLEKENKTYKQTIFLEPQTRSFAVQFFPEGGDLIAGTPRTVAFKAEASDGYPIETAGVVLNERGDTLLRFQSEHDGMGRFVLTPEVGESYRVVCTAACGDFTTSLPAIHPSACALTVLQRGNQLHYRVEGQVPEQALLVAHMRGAVRCVVPVSRQRNSGIVVTDSLCEGVLHLLLVDSCGRPRSERLVYIDKPHPHDAWRVKANKSAYGKREKVRIALSLQQDSLPLCGLFSGSVTDRNIVRYDSLGENLRTNLLLSSELKGYIHHPEFYFQEDSPQRRYLLDLVMMTHGWRRFKTENLFETTPFIPRYYFEHGQYLSGRVIGMAGRVAKGATISALALTQEGVLGQAVSDSVGRFLISGLDFQDTTVLMLSARDRRGRLTQRIDVDTLYRRPSLMRYVPFMSRERSEQLQSTVDEYLTAQQKVSGIYNGLKHYTLEEASVTAVNPRKPRGGAFATVYDTASLAIYERLPLYNALIHMPGVQVWFNPKTAEVGFSLKNRNGIGYIPAQIIINGRSVPTDFLYKYDIQDVEFIRMVRDVITIDDGTLMAGGGVNTSTKVEQSNDMSNLNFKTTGAGYRIEIFLKPGAGAAKPDFQLYHTIGYAEQIEFYHPVYDTPEQKENSRPDKRTTLYWNPYLRIQDGKASIEFYSDDTENPVYEITIEGVTPEGIPCRYQQKL